MLRSDRKGGGGRGSAGVKKKKKRQERETLSISIKTRGDEELRKGLTLISAAPLIGFEPVIRLVRRDRAGLVGARTGRLEREAKRRTGSGAGGGEGGCGDGRGGRCHADAREVVKAVL